MQQLTPFRALGGVLAIAAGLTGSPCAEPAPAPLPPPGSNLGSNVQPGIGRGDFEFFFDASTAHPTVAPKQLVRVVVQLPVQQLFDAAKRDKIEIALQMRAFDAAAALRALARSDSAARPPASREQLEQADGAKQAMLGAFEGVVSAGEARARSTIEVDSRSKLLETDYRLFELSLELAPGDYVVEVLAENLSRGKRGLLDRLRHKHTNAVGRMLVRVPDLSREPGLADLTFQSGHGTQTDYPSRLYGLLNDSLHVRTALFGHGAYAVLWQARDRDGKVHWRDSLQVTADGRRELALHRTVNALPAGEYQLQLTTRGPQGNATSSRSFDVAWSLVSWKKSQRDLELEAAIVLTDDQYEIYEALPLGEKEQFMDKLWARYDPTPDTGQNERLLEFQRRVAYADLNFSEGQRGALSDRGKVYIHLGAPAEIQAQAVPSHLAGQGAEEAIEKVDDAYAAAEHGGTAAMSDQKELENLGSTVGEDPRERSVRRQERERVVGSGNEVVSYEVWIYTGQGHPLLPQDRGVAGDNGLRILFLDLEGYGRYRLRKASARLDIHGLRANY